MSSGNELSVETIFGSVFVAFAVAIFALAQILRSALLQQPMPMKRKTVELGKDSELQMSSS